MNTNDRLNRKNNPAAFGRLEETSINHHGSEQPSPNARFSPLIEHYDLKGCLDAFLTACRVEGLASASIGSYKGLVGEFVKFAFGLGLMTPQIITAIHVRQFLQEKQKTCRPASIHSYYRHTQRFFNWLVQEGILEQSPMTNIKAPRVPSTIIRPFSREDLNRMLFLCDDQTFLGSRNKAILLVFIDTGLRLSELTHVMLTDIDFTRETIKVLGKSKHERVVRISRNTQKAILKYLNKRSDQLPNLWVTEEKKALTTWGVIQIIRVLGKRAEIKDVRCSPHTLRHTAAMLSLQGGASAFELQLMLGHTTLDMTKKYLSSLSSENAAEAHKKFSPVERLNLK